MFKKIAIAGATAAVIVGAGTAAIAATGDSSSTTGTPASSSTSSPTATGAAGRLARRHPRIAALLEHHAVHGSIVTKDSTGTYVTHDGVVGAVTAVSSTSITVKASDGFTQTYAVTSTTKVRQRKDPKADPLTIASVHVGDTVGVLGTGTVTSPTATVIVEGVS